MVGNDPINKMDPTGLAPDPVWSLDIPSDAKTVSDLSLIKQFKDEAYNRSAFYWDHTSPTPPGVVQTPIGQVNFTQENYPKLHQIWWNTFKSWEAREKTLQEPLNAVQKFLNDYPSAKYGSYKPTPGPFLTTENATYPNYKKQTIHISRPWDRTFHDVASAVAIGKGGPGSKTLEDVDPSTGYIQPERMRPRTSKQRINPNGYKNEVTDARMAAGEWAAEGFASGLQESLNGLKEVNVVVWYLDDGSKVAGFYVEGQSLDVGEAVLQQWVKPKENLENRGKW